MGPKSKVAPEQQPPLCHALVMDGVRVDNRRVGRSSSSIHGDPTAARCCASCMGTHVRGLWDIHGAGGPSSSITEDPMAAGCSLGAEAHPHTPSPHPSSCSHVENCPRCRRHTAPWGHTAASSCFLSAFNGTFQHIPTSEPGA